MMRTADWRPAPLPGVAPKPQDGDAVLLGPDGEPRLLLNDTALAIWQLCDGRTTVTEMVAACATLFDVSAEQAYDDVSAALADLERAGVLR